MTVEVANIHETIPARMRELQVPGVVVGIWHDGRETVLPFGVTNVEHPLSVTADTGFQIGSNTKPVTATVIMRLVEDGRIALDAPVRTYLPAFRVADEEVSRRVTVRHLLTHTAGWEGDVWLDTGRGDDALARMIELMAELPQLIPLGSLLAYNNAAFNLLGRIVEVVTEKPYEVAARELVLEPLGMIHSHFFPEEVITGRFACGHTLRDGRLMVEPRWQWPRSGSASGRLISTAGDMLRFARFHMGDGTAEDGTPILTPDSLQQMQTPATPANRGRRVGLSWFVRDVGGIRIVEHGGSTAGQLSTFSFVPEANLAVVVLTNSEPGGRLGGEVEEEIYRRYLGIEEESLEPIDVDRGRLERYAGRYTAPLSDVELTIEGEHLLLRSVPNKPILGRLTPPAPPARVAMVGETLLRVEEGSAEGTIIEIITVDGAGSEEYLRMGTRLWRREAGS